MRFLRLLTSGLVAASAACGGGGTDDGGATGPPPPNGNTQTLGSIATSVPSLSLGAGSAAAIGVVAYDASNQVIANPGTPTFTSSAPTVAEVDGTGTVLAVSAGTAQVTVRLTFGGVSKAAEVPVTVIGALPNDANVVASSSDYVFTPATVVVHRGGSVTWNFGLLEHTVTFSGGTGSPTNITAGYSTSVSRTFATAGDYSYVCTIHSGMGGKVVVR